MKVHLLIEDILIIARFISDHCLEFYVANSIGNQPGSDQMGLVGVDSGSDQMGLVGVDLVCHAHFRREGDIME